MEEDQVQRGEPLLAVDEVSRAALRLDIHERTEEHLLPRAPASTLVGFERLPEIVQEHTDVVRSPRVLALVHVDQVAVALEQVAQAEDTRADAVNRHYILALITRPCACLP
ncbi:hypothetical protein BJF78_03895 [Pseudonocardia sp. CNS-139]|nr:hypothetical protein BJF78_03895 [Pseudonocardia sp. CNS-139]